MVVESSERSLLLAFEQISTTLLRAVFVPSSNRIRTAFDRLSKEMELSFINILSTGNKNI